MAGKQSTSVQMIKISEIEIINPRGRNKKKHQMIIENIVKLGLKKPITVSPKLDDEGSKRFNLVCGQGRLEAFLSQKEEYIPAIVVNASKEECLLMSLVENLARRRQPNIELVKEIAALQKRGYTIDEMAQKTDLSTAYVSGILRLYRDGEERLIDAVEKGSISVSTAVMIASSNDSEIQRALTDAYERKNLHGSALLKVRRIIQKRQALGKALSGQRRKSKEGVSASLLVKAYERETTKQKRLIKKARLVETSIIFISNALKTLYRDEGFCRVLRSESLYTLPKYLAAQIYEKGGAA